MKYSLSARILETKDLIENIKNDIRLDFEEFATLAQNCGFDGINLRAWQITDKSEINRIKKSV